MPRRRLRGARGSGSVVEHHLAKVRVAGSNPVFRSGRSFRDLAGGVAERRGNGLQSRLHGFKSRLHLSARPADPRDPVGWCERQGETRSKTRKWLSGRASPCQGEGRGFESRLPLWWYPRTISSAGERFPDTEEVTGSIPVSSTGEIPGPRPGIFCFPAPCRPRGAAPRRPDPARPAGQPPGPTSLFGAPSPLVGRSPRSTGPGGGEDVPEPSGTACRAPATAAFSTVRSTSPMPPFNRMK